MSLRPAVAGAPGPAEPHDRCPGKLNGIQMAGVNRLRYDYSRFFEADVSKKIQPSKP